jgi:hypothetical protein
MDRLFPALQIDPERAREIGETIIRTARQLGNDYSTSEHIMNLHGIFQNPIEYGIACILVGRITDTSVCNINLLENNLNRSLYNIISNVKHLC